VAYPEEPPSLDPYSADGDSAATRDLLRPVLPTLLTVTPDVEYAPGLAARVPGADDITFDPLTVTYNLHAEADWSDGTPITSADVVFTWEVIKGAKGFPGSSRYRLLKEIEVVNEKSFRLIFTGRYRGWEDLFSAGDFVLPKHYLEGKDVHAELAKGLPISGGAFVITEFTEGLEVVYRDVPGWWGPSALSEEVRVQFVPIVEVALKLMKDGRSDVLVATTQPNLSSRIEQHGGEGASAYGATWWELGFNHEGRGTNEPRERLAIAHEIDRAGMVEAVVREQGRALQTLPLPGDGAEFGGLTHDPKKAAELRRDAGGIVPLDFSAPGGNEMARVLQRAIQAALKEAGIQADTRNPDVARFYSSWLREGSYDLALWERRASPRGSLWERFHSSRKAPGGRNLTRISDDALDSALDDLDASWVPEEEAANRAGGSRRGEAIGPPRQRTVVLTKLVETLPVIPIFEAKAFIGFRSGITGPAPNATVDGPFWNLYDWFAAE
jgi:peptide/nickel transport system substrate-binding protein